MSITDHRFDRRQFLITLGASAPLLAQGCALEPEEQVELRDAQYDRPPTELADASKSIKIKAASSSQSCFDQAQACSIAKALPGVAIGDQIRITRKSSEYALYTVVERRSSDNPNIVRLGFDARLRLGTSKSFSAALGIPVVASELSDAQAEAAGELVERVVDDGSHDAMVVIAPHGGAIEVNTDLQAEAVAAALACSSWICKGWRKGGGAYERWHVTSTEISPNSFPALGQVADRGFGYCVAFHGIANGGVLVGGGAPLELKQWVHAAIVAAIDDPAISVSIPASTDQYNGDSAKNLVNWLCADGVGGIQIEQGIDVRLEHWQAVADAVISVFSQLI